MTQTTITALIVAAMLASLFLVLVGTFVAQAITERREPVGSGHHCLPGTCPTCDTFGCWAADAADWQ